MYIGGDDGSRSGLGSVMAGGLLMYTVVPFAQAASSLGESARAALVQTSTADVAAAPDRIAPPRRSFMTTLLPDGGCTERDRAVRTAASGKTPQLVPTRGLNFA